MNFKENESPQKLRGGYYTPKQIALFLTKWVLKNQPVSILEPSCGDGVFFEAIKETGNKSLKELWGFEIEQREVQKSRRVVEGIKKVEGKILEEDFLRWYLNRPLAIPFVDAVVGNPPFIRYQYLEEEQQDYAKKIFESFSLKFTKHTNAWVPFVVASLSILKPGGRLGMVLPSELLHVLHAESLRSYLAEHCSRLLIIDPQELWFKNTLQGAILLLAEKKELFSERSQGISIIPTKSKSILDENPEDYFQRSDYVNGDVLSGKWMRALLSPIEREVLNSASGSDLVFQFEDVADVAVGIVTGANKFFLVPDDVVEMFDLQDWAHPMFGRSEHVPGVIYAKDVHSKNKTNGKPANFIWFKDEPINSLPKKVRSYLMQGEGENIHLRYKCRIREPWYSVPSVYSTNVGMLKRSNNFPKLIFNKIKAYTTDTAYRIVVKKGNVSSLVYSFVNSLTALTAELEGRHYGGGVLELVPSEIRKLSVPVIKANRKSLISLDTMIRESVPPDEMMSIQDEDILFKVGFTNQEIQVLHGAWKKLRHRRQRKD